LLFSSQRTGQAAKYPEEPTSRIVFGWNAKHHPITMPHNDIEDALYNHHSRM